LGGVNVLFLPALSILGLAPYLRILPSATPTLAGLSLQKKNRTGGLPRFTVSTARGPRFEKTMASLTSARAARTALCSACRFACPSTTAGPATVISRRGLSTATEQAPADIADKPRWSYTPPSAKAPFSLRFDSKRREFPVNSDPKTLDQFYIRMLGADGDKLLSEEVKWLAVTHKSFDQGRRGFNDRLAFLGAHTGSPCVG
jgi:hypothetical protein